MTAQSVEGPPRPIAVGDIVASHSDALDAWTAAQITGLGRTWGATGQAAVLELDWSGPEPAKVGDLGDLRPLRLTHHAHRNQPSHCNYDWLLPRNYKVLGSAPLLLDGMSNSFASGWRLGEQLELQRRWDVGQSDRDTRSISLPASDLTSLLDQPAPMPEVWRLKVNDIESLNCADLAQSFPNVSHLSLAGDLGTLAEASALEQMSRLRTLFIYDLFGMTRADAVTIEHLPALEMLGLYSTPADYATAMRKAWKPEIANGTFVEIRSPRKPEWVEENRDNPLRGWDGREHISAARYRKAVAQYHATRRAVIAALSTFDEVSASEQLSELGRGFAQEFNRLDAGRNPFIETEERDELFLALDAAVSAAEQRHGRQFARAREALASGTDAFRDW
ncbi:hypothetical protein [Nocardioides jejuensis]|uniref:Leucine-rich repeat domain-containing protein n=1 Tax=Nocardioides jejuensis TaxID=2502782 RepID=A0A4R1CDM0_9ACTN|nr:hypothetical protein [Nocardioides jejuensis]TCJ28076.1 hypothetical protein EPD65_08815 [Nocardioides jejuensis]